MSLEATHKGEHVDIKYFTASDIYIFFFVSGCSIWKTVIIATKQSSIGVNMKFKQ
jgi:hypothetical protein